MEPRFERGAALSPLEESSAEVSRDSGVVSQSASSLSTDSEALSSLSQSPSFGPSLSQSPSFGPSVSQSPSFGPSVSQSHSFGPAAPQCLSFGPPGPQRASFGATASQSPSFGPTGPHGAISGPAAPQSPSFDQGTVMELQATLEQDEDMLKRTAESYASFSRANAGEEILCLEKSLEEMLTRVDEFVGMLDMIRNDTSQVVNISLPQIHRKAEDMREIYRKIDKLEAFVKMVAANVNAMEEQVTQAEGEVKTLPGAFKKIFRTMNVPGFLNKPASPKRTAPQHQEVPTVFRTDEYFTSHPEQ